MEWRARRKEEGGVALRVVVDERKKSKEALERATEPGWKGQERAIRSIKKSSRARARADKTVDSREERAPGQELAAEGTL